MKILKDLYDITDFEPGNREPFIQGSCVVKTSDLRDTAKEWIIRLESHKNYREVAECSLDCKICNITRTNLNEDDIINWIKYFFGVDEE